MQLQRAKITMWKYKKYVHRVAERPDEQLPWTKDTPVINWLIKRKLSYFRILQEFSLTPTASQGIPLVHIPQECDKCQPARARVQIAV